MDCERVCARVSLWPLTVMAAGPRGRSEGRGAGPIHTTEYSPARPRHACYQLKILFTLLSLEDFVRARRGTAVVAAAAVAVPLLVMSTQGWALSVHTD